MEHEKDYRVTIRLDPEYDVDLIKWLEETPTGSRSVLIRAAWRAGLRQRDDSNPLDLEKLRQVLAEELERALVRRAIGQTGEIPSETDDELQGEYSEKLDRMLGGLTQTQFDFGEEG